GRYKIMKAYMPTRGNLGLDMMTRTATVQVNLDFSSEADMVRKMRVGLALQPVATALFANSPFTEGKPNGFLSYRSQIWTDTDPDRCGMLNFVFDDDMSFERYAEHALDVPMYFVQRDGGFIDASGQSFRDFVAGRLPALPGEHPTLKDWDDHLTTLFPEIRMKRYIEMRGADGGPWGRLCALPALWVGLLYDSIALDQAEAIANELAVGDLERLRADVPRTGLATPAGARTLHEVARDVLAIAAGGLKRRAVKGIHDPDERSYLTVLNEIVESGRTPAEELLEAYHGRWGGSVDPAFSELAY
ncbi:MAG: glutamate--cysteine ligase, partial [Alphaproteobacteria bacterium]|nr:glutamate--cysteine ligase [Alphaproteobacteria bacterium]